MKRLSQIAYQAMPEREKETVGRIQETGLSS